MIHNYCIERLMAIQWSKKAITKLRSQVKLRYKITAIFKLKLMKHRITNIRLILYASFLQIMCIIYTHIHMGT